METIKHDNLHIEGASDSTSPDNKFCQMEWGWRDTPMDLLHAEWQKNYSHTDRKNNGGVHGQVLYAEGHFITL